MKVCFMGTPDIAVPTLKALIDKHTVSCVVTQPDKPKGRGNKLTPPPVKVLAETEKIPVLQPIKAKDPSFFDELKKFNFDVIVVIAYGQILPKNILNMCKYGALNIHGSLLPKYRGAGPIQWSIINGEKITGVTIMQMNENMDAGDILLSREIPIREHTSEDMFKEMGLVGAEVLLEALYQIDSISRTPQDESQATYAPMLTKEMGLIDWTKSNNEIINLINGLNPWPVAYTSIYNKTIKIYKVAEVNDIFYKGQKPGTVLTSDPKNGITVKTGDGAISLGYIQAKGGKVMESTEYVKGNLIQTGTVL